MPTDVTGACPYEAGPVLTRIKQYCSYYLAGLERGEPTPEKPRGYRHWQFFFQLKKDQSWAWIHKKLPNIHVEARRGTVEQCMEYCMKDGKFEQDGQVTDHPGQGFRTDIVAFKDAALKHTDEYLVHNYTGLMARYPRFPNTVRKACLKPRSVLTEIFWIFGPPGCGKTLFIESKYPDLYPHDISPWWDGYTGQEVVFMDELSDVYPWLKLLRLGNKSKYKVPVKGDYVEFTSKRIYISTNIEPQQVYQKEWSVNAEAMTRRTKFYRARRGEPHELVLQRVKWLHGNWCPEGDEYVEHVDYPPEDDSSKP